MMIQPSLKIQKLKNKQNLTSKRIDITKFAKVVTWLCLTFKSDVTMPVNHLVSLVSVLERVQENRGTRGLISFNKSMRSNLLNYLSGNPLRDRETAVTEDGVPVLLGNLIPYIRGRQYKVISVVLTILYCTRSLKTKPEPDFEPIVAPFKGDLSNVSMFASAFWKELGYRPQVQLSRALKNCNLETYSTKKGPNGHALVTAIQDARALPDSLVQSLETMCPKLGYLLKKVVRNKTFLDLFLKPIVKMDYGLRLTLLRDAEKVGHDECYKE